MCGLFCYRATHAQKADREKFRSEREGAGLLATWLTLRENKDFRTLYYRGRSQVHPALVTYVRKNKLGVPRVGITTGKKLGGAVQRSRCRRIIREAFRPQYKNIGGWDIVFVARTRLLNMKSTQLAPIVEKQLRQLDVIKDG